MWCDFRFWHSLLCWWWTQDRKSTMITSSKQLVQQLATISHSSSSSRWRKAKKMIAKQRHGFRSFSTIRSSPSMAATRHSESSAEIFPTNLSNQRFHLATKLETTSSQKRADIWKTRAKTIQLEHSCRRDRTNTSHQTVKSSMLNIKPTKRASAFMATIFPHHHQSAPRSKKASIWSTKASDFKLSDERTIPTTRSTTLSASD